MLRSSRTILILATLAAPGAQAADYGGSGSAFETRALREERALVRDGVRCRLGPPVPVSSPRDPTYVGSIYGLGRPSQTGVPPPLGIDPLEKRIFGCRRSRAENANGH